jgi:type I restriction enzyme R subunit
MSHRIDKQETRANVDTLICNELCKNLPMSYPDKSINGYRTKIFDYFYSRAA